MHPRLARDDEPLNGVELFCCLTFRFIRQKRSKTNRADEISGTSMARGKYRQRRVHDPIPMALCNVECAALDRTKLSTAPLTVPVQFAKTRCHWTLRSVSIPIRGPRSAPPPNISGRHWWGAGSRSEKTGGLRCKRKRVAFARFQQR
jgi:hypothetical protein